MALVIKRRKRYTLSDKRVKKDIDKELACGRTYEVLFFIQRFRY